MEYPKFTIIMRGYTKEEAFKIAKNIDGLEENFAIEVTLNTLNAFEIIRLLNENFGNHLKVGAGTVRNLKEAEEAIANNAQFLLGPHVFSKEIFDLAKKNQVLTIPGAFTPSEIVNQFEMGADIVKVFPARTLGADYFKDIQAPLGKIPLMAVGGINFENYQSFFKKGASFVGIGSSIFNGRKILDMGDMEIRGMLRKYIEKLQEVN
ncbi:bifunctional 4-hydroxy-2-oxoglutarate aldolase/2-dehydro-3-deoxy-phosphogluconate aldolase [Facklamia miroungae]|uniref:2-dehydro-3-deoxyphosphogluconate aldolase / (4S)-4-hydroxy-2-oxoglutarate aldolase n=1 Tax=Facklamia miroungae TaxID=120956 RepID=A0A1G7RVR4_9LACT|nr:bifunctional 4-hydroxy-2-oxoglutarate aldolase/2-dehydro-3-deoxy-phosphogluconate aldolase [Facklamia miroungae]NKZ29254.1 bifunctional 4-hydroxy-2-oxoglutarate aldolase/2-dehydro-3-deoxy-phosphogluconate aldolase [Facklamia miroungae]SDG14917.1 2-dehydro-3-deoxyphosphogluconate aldolase / (4S)-4-hydroxy-2-oxoglutarate aldolase [Facklamia miroungae]